jgi:hypothetical protein
MAFSILNMNPTYLLSSDKSVSQVINCENTEIIMPEDIIEKTGENSKTLLRPD